MARDAHWAGQFYTSNAQALRGEIDAMLASWPGREASPWALLPVCEDVGHHIVTHLRLDFPHT